MRRSIGLMLSTILGIGVFAGPAPADEPPPKVDFNEQIRPILSDKCFLCHGPDPKNRKAKLRLDEKEGAFGETNTGIRPVVPGDLDESELFYRIISDDESDRMPPKSLGRELSDAEVDLIKRWILEGAEWTDHWAFETPVAVDPPATSRDDWGVNPIDGFVLARLEAEGLSPAPEASRERLIRRLSFDLTGLPPSLGDTDAFLADDRPGAYERLVDRLLSSPRFGERMAVDWLDVARYADTFGYQADVYRAMWPWRDWVVRAFNDNLPYDQFITWQLAGDLLPNPTRDQILATAFNRHHRQTNEGGSIEEEWRADYVADRTITLGSAFLGLTLDCARCHTHKYDPITQKDFYSLFAFFNNIDESGLYSHFTDAVPTPTLMLTTPEQDAAIADVERRIQDAEADLDRFDETRTAAFEDWLAGLDRSGPIAPEPTGLIGDFPLDAIDGDKVANRADSDKPGTVFEDPKVVEGREGGAIRLSGENGVTLPLGNFDRFQPFSIGLWIQVPDHKDRAVILKRSMAWTDAGSRGYQLLIEDGKLSAGLIHFWPGNAIGVMTRDPLPINEWVHVALSYDGSSRADGLILYVDGRAAPREVVRDGLTKNITGGGADDLVIGQRFRDRGFIDGEVADLKVFNRALAPIEAAQLHDSKVVEKLLSADPASLSADDRRDLFAYYLANVDAERPERLAALRALREERSRLVDPIEEIMVMEEMPEPRPTFVLLRGDYDSPGDQVEPDVPSRVFPFPADQPRNRLGLARWLTDPKNPLTARVTVNRWWQSLFGRGLVATPDDFGAQGELPSHPKLLDWLARELVDSGWDVKHVWRLMVMSATYRQSSDAPAELHAQDPDNVLLARGPRFRLPAEMLRDNALAAGGLLVGEMGGPPVKPFQPPGLWEEKSSASYVRDEGAGSRRRSLYTYWKRTSPPPSMLTFDAANREVCSVKRLPTSTPLQALVLLNDPQYVEASRALAERAFHEGGAALDDRLSFVFRMLTGRRADSRTLETLRGLYDDQRDEFQSGRADAGQLLAVGDDPPDPNLDHVDLAAMSVVARALMSYDETVMKR